MSVEGRYAAARFYSWSGVLIPKEGSKMAVVCRPARMDDLKRADEIVVASINELTERRGFGKMASSHPPKFQGFSLRDDTEGLAPCHDSNLCEKSTKRLRLAHLRRPTISAIQSRSAVHRTCRRHRTTAAF